MSEVISRSTAIPTNETDESANCNEFILQLNAFHQKFGTGFLPILLNEAQRLDLFKLYRLVTIKGGYQVFNQQDCWNLLCKPYGLPNTANNFVSNIKNVYMNYLSGFEDARRLKRQIDAQNSISALKNIPYAQPLQQNTPNQPPYAQTHNLNTFKDTPTFLKKNSFNDSSTPINVNNLKSEPYKELNSLQKPSFISNGYSNQSLPINSGHDTTNHSNFANKQPKQFQKAQRKSDSSFSSKIKSFSQLPSKNNTKDQTNRNLASTSTNAAAADSIKKLENSLFGNSLNVLDFFGGPSCKIVLALSSHLPNEIEWSIKQLLQFSTYCNEDYCLKTFAPFMLDELVDLLEICRKNLVKTENTFANYKNTKNHETLQCICADFEFSEDEFFDETDESDQDNCTFNFQKLIDCKDHYSQSKMYEQLALDIILILRNLAIASTKNATYFNGNSFLLKEINYWFKDNSDFFDIGTESKILFLEFIETLIPYAKGSELLKYVFFWEFCLNEFLESNDLYLISLSARYISNFWIKTGFSGLDDQLSDLDIFNHSLNLSSIVSRCFRILVSGGQIENELQDNLCHLLLSIVVRETNMLQKIIDQNEPLNRQPWSSSLGDSFDQQIILVTTLQYNIFKVYTQGSTSNASELLCNIYNQTFEIKSKEYQNIISSCHNILNSMFKIIIKLLYWAEAFENFLKITECKSSKSSKVLSVNFFKEKTLEASSDISVNIEPKYQYGNYSQDINNSSPNIFGFQSRNQKSTENNFAKFSKVYLCTEYLIKLTEIAIDIPTESAKEFITIFKV
ncbi:hypothetical protein BB561_005740 [Smittium simulii]|uniref:ARID domain-containing protein n=1 Tax=Smittium simulii TaxID=133385 RepID=A0A2T9Y8N1_9FUNG|nr:hypothetical protein BB561_005740 [Smittium simulii]